ncbi:MAG: PspC domain-containing protein [Crocinitomicaceae bacterium]|nr:PspC domain-containing protein [Crocinitomicaceae bacterium]MBT5403546.1 PspC domain-containing protein [Crocinitomicaceae bacterium]MBT6514699.1 PspC domain-containing protein [Crocinitomicaceae bacterium]
MIRNILSYFEKRAFGVCEWWGKKLGISVGNIRIFFIYLSFLTLGSPIVIYLIMAFILDHKKFFKFKRRRKSIWDL